METFFSAASKVLDMDEGTGLPGLKGYPYKDGNGFWTIGRGHYIGPSIIDLKLPDGAIEALFVEDLGRAIKEARLVVGNTFFNSLTQARQVALVTMLFTLGRNKFLKFEETIQAMLDENWQKVSDHILASKWAKDVDPQQRPGIGRDDRMAYMFKTGQFHPYYGIL